MTKEALQDNDSEDSTGQGAEDALHVTARSLATWRSPLPPYNHDLAWGTRHAQLSLSGWLAYSPAAVHVYQLTPWRKIGQVFAKMC